MYDIANYYEPDSISEAVSLLREHPDAVPVCGGSDVLIRIREGKLAGCSLVSLRNIRGLNGVTLKEDRTISIGASTSFRRLTENKVIREYIPLLGEAVDQVGGPQIRNIGTIGGNLCNGAVSADSAPACFCLNARLRIVSKDGDRILPIKDFYLGPGRVALKPGELLTHILISKEDYNGYTGHYIKYAMRNAMDIAAVSCCVMCRADLRRQILEDVKIAFGVAAPVPFCCEKTQQRLNGMSLDDELYQTIEQSVRNEINPRDSWRASREFRLQVGGEIARRALKRAIELQEVK
ncbi:xanthine dehydrogenase subunit XdhB [Anaerostipes sp.]|uniref:xanthine dehydrogenase subunit XdhB n=1 Tax=Anaerostipes sp. TaxID=1872530 RepID=UPI0025C1934E|nr:xanthine dehydrogenase subunit XdhB [Anaerostipes sp.]MBS7007215.1 xanthine dehydrogenase FAD-binding subunit XdhB [Anaerostipes sp.]